jgi:putative transposase
MARAPRAWQAGFYHLAAHGSDDRYLFPTERDRDVFLDGLREVLERFELSPVAYALLGTHYHLLLRIPDARVSKALQQLHTWYARLHNKLTRRTAHLFRAHFFAREIDGYDDLLWTARYVAWNPVTAGLAEDPFEWRWSSAAATAGLAPPPLPLALGAVAAAFGGAPNWRLRYRELIRQVEASELPDPRRRPLAARCPV